MNFKHPEFFYFLLLLLVPIIVHLFQLRRFKTEYFTNVKFLKNLNTQTRKSSKIKKYLLLASRLLMLLFLIVAFAQPFFKSKDYKNSNNELYIILDNSYSMQANGRSGPLLKRAVQELLEHIPQNQQFSLVTNSQTYWHNDIKSIQKELQEMNYSATPFVLENCLAKINAKKSANNKDVVIITDAIGLKENQLKSIDKNDKAYFIIPKAEDKKNISIDSVFINKNLDNFYEIVIKLTTTIVDDTAVPLALYNKNKLIAKTVVSFKKLEENVLLTIPKDDFHGYVSIEEKGLAYDNKLFFSISKPQKIKVLAVGAVAKSGFLSRIYTADEFDYLSSELPLLDYNLIDKQDAIVLNELATIPQALQTTLKNFVAKGGNIIVIPAENCPLEQLNLFLQNFGTVSFTSMQNTQQLITKINFAHPLFASVFEKKVENFQYPSAKQSFEIKSSFAPILSFANQGSFLFAMPQLLSNVYVFTAPINKINSNFQNAPLIVPTFYNMAQNKEKTGVNSIIIGKNKSFLIDALLGKDEILSIKNDIENFIPVQQILNNKVKISFNDNPKTAGNFEVFNKDKSLKNISFNFDRTESNLGLANVSALADYKIVDSIETVFNKIHTDRTDSQLWKIFIIMALLFLIAEILIQKYIR